MDLDTSHPAISDLRLSARRRMPKFAFEYLDSGTGSEIGVTRNRAALDAVLFMPAILGGTQTADLSRRFMGRDHPLPWGIAPIGMSGMIWPGAEEILARSAVAHGIPYSISSVATRTPEEIGPVAGDLGWFQLYAPADPEVRRDMIRRIGAAGFDKLILTVDVPGESRRERQRRAQVVMPPRLTPKMVLSMLLHPVWTLSMARTGAPRLKFAESYVDPAQLKRDPFVHAGRVIRGYPDWDYLRAVRQEWAGDLLVKGVQRPEDAVRLVEEGVDGIWVSNHSARQFEAGPAAIDRLPLIRSAVGPDVPIVFDSGVEGGLDIMRGLALGADMVFLGRAFHYAVAALGAAGAAHVNHILEADMRANMAQLGAVTLEDLKDCLVKP